MARDKFFGAMTCFGTLVIGACLIAAGMYPLGFIALGVAAVDAAVKFK